MADIELLASQWLGCGGIDTLSMIARWSGAVRGPRSTPDLDLERHQRMVVWMPGAAPVAGQVGSQPDPVAGVAQAALAQQVLEVGEGLMFPGRRCR